MSVNTIREKFTKKHPSLDEKYAAKIVDIFFNAIKSTILNGKRVELRGLGAFSLRERKERVVPHPKTQEVLKLAKQKDVYFRASKKLEDSLNA